MISISSVRLTPARERDIQSGLLGYVTCVINGVIRLDGIALRQTRDGRPTLSYPSRSDAGGQRHPFVRPITDAARRELEAQVFGALGLLEERP